MRSGNLHIIVLQSGFIFVGNKEYLKKCVLTFQLKNANNLVCYRTLRYMDCNIILNKAINHCYMSVSSVDKEIMKLMLTNFAKIY